MRATVLVASLSLIACKQESGGQEMAKPKMEVATVPTNAPSGAAAEEAKRVLSAPNDVLAAVDFSVLEVGPAKPKGTVVTIGVQNKTEREVHIIGFQAEAQAQLVDKDGFSSKLDIAAPGQLRDGVTVPPSAKVKASLVFEGDGKNAAKVRLWGKELPVPAAP